MRWYLPGLVAAVTGATAWCQAVPSVQQQVSVTASRSPSPVGETARTEYELSGEELNAYPAVALDQALRQHAGFELFRRASSRIANPTSEGISLRGLGSTAASRTLVLLDGAPLNDPFGGWIHWDEVPTEAIQSVTLVTGGGSDLYGSSALGGVIDVTPAVPKQTSMELWGAGGSQPTSDVGALSGFGSRRIEGLVAVESVRTAGYLLPDPALLGTVDTPANVRSQSYRTELGRRNLAARRVFLTGNLLNEDHANGTPLQTNATRLWRYLGGYESPESTRANGRMRVFGSQEGYRQSFSSISASRKSEALTRLQRVHTQEVGGTADGALHWEHLTAVAGADLRDIRGEDNETPISKGLPNGLQGVTARQRFTGGFGEVLGQFRGWSGAGSLRVDGSSNLDTRQVVATATTGTETLQPNRTEILLSPRVGLIRALGTKGTVHASAFRAFRAPSMNELYRTGQVGQETTLANPALQSERATGYEVGTDFKTHQATVQATYFWTEINRPVSAVLISQTATTITNQRQNLGQIRSRGLELAAHLFSARAFSGTVGYQFAQATVTKFSSQPALVGNWIPQVPRNSFTAQLRGDSKKFGQLTLAARAGGQAFDDANNQFPLAGFFSLDLSGARSINSKLTVTFQVQNLTNQRPQVSRTPILTLGSPIFAEAGLRLRIGK